MKKEAGLVRFDTSIPGELAAGFDARIAKAGFANGSGAVRDLIRNPLVAAVRAAGTGEMIRTFSRVYDHHLREPGDALTELRHQLTLQLRRR